MVFDPASLKSDHGDPQGEAAACREAAALFDFSFMSRGMVEGPGALAAISALTSRRLDDLDAGGIRYGVRAADDGHLLADLTVWRTGEATFELMSGRAEDIEDLVISADRLGQRAEDLSGETCVFAVQGPAALAALAPLLSKADAARLSSVSYFQSIGVEMSGVEMRIGRLGYTGERGFELVVPRADAQRLWSELSECARPAGFIAADMLRIEAGFVLFANEFQVPVTAAEAGLGTFAGAVCSSPQYAPELELIAFRAEANCDVTLYRPHPLLARPSELGVLAVTSACASAAAGGVLGLGYIRKGADDDATLHDPAGQFHNIRRVSRPFVDPDKRRPRGPWS